MIIHVDVIRCTARAVLVSQTQTDGRDEELIETWLPRSQIHDGDDVENGLGQTLEVESWVCRRAGLE